MQTYTPSQLLQKLIDGLEKYVEEDREEQAKYAQKIADLNENIVDSVRMIAECKAALELIENCSATPVVTLDPAFMETGG